MEYYSGIEEKNGSYHEIKIEFDFEVKNNGIGEYEYWGCRCYDHGQNFVEIEEVNEAFVYRSGWCRTKEECPKCSNVKIKAKQKENEIWYFWEHERKINNDSWVVEKIVEDALNMCEFEDEFEPEPEFECYD